MYTGSCLVVLDPAMGVERSNHCVTISKPDMWVWPKGSWYKYLKVCPTLVRKFSLIPYKVGYHGAGEI